MITVKDLTPKLIWSYFSEILTIPRPSKKEEKILAYLIDFAKNNGLEWKQDKAGNLLITKPATKGFENRATVLLQSHVDMVCEKNASVEFVFMTDAIDAYIDNGWVKARGTTLGADNGIGIAAQMAVLTDPELKHGPVECLFTVDEETGLTGAFNLEPGFFKGKYLLNLDSEDDGEIFIGCAGGVDTLISIPINRVKPLANQHSGIVKVSGLQGGHSGDDIHKGRGNANKIIARFAIDFLSDMEYSVSSISGGNLRNAIPREAEIHLSVPSTESGKLQERLSEYAEILKTEFELTEPELTLEFTEAEPPEYILEKQVISQILQAIHICPNGVIEMSASINNLVQTSTNLASIRTNESGIDLVTSQRSSIDSAKFHVASRIKTLFQLIGANVRNSDAYPGWTPDTNSVILELTREKHKELFGEYPIARAIHAGLECGLFLKKYPHLDMVSFGPTIKGAHSPAERMEIITVEKFWKLLVGILAEIPTE